MTVVRRGGVDGVSPWEMVPGRPFGRAFPFGFRRQPFARPFAIGRRVVPVHPDHGLVGLVQAWVVPVSRGRMVGGLHEVSIVAV